MLTLFVFFPPAYRVTVRSEAYNLDDETKFSPAEDYSCAQVLGEPACGGSNRDCIGAHAPDSSKSSGYDGFLDVGFGQTTTPTAIIIVENYYAGFMSGIDLWNNITMQWVPVWRGSEDNRTENNDPRYTLLRFNSSISTNRVRLLTNYTSYNEEIDAVFLVTEPATSAPTPAAVSRRCVLFVTSFDCS